MREFVVTALFFVVGLSLMLALGLVSGAVVAAIGGMRCPRCGGRVSWLRSSFGTRGLPEARRRCVFCFRCRRLIVQERTAGGWIEDRG